MYWFEILLLAVGLSMDAFAVAIGIGLTVAKTNMKKALIVGLYFGLFQAAMPLVGYLVASLFARQIQAYSHWVAFGMLCLLGGKMIIGGLRKEKCKDRTCQTEPCRDRTCPGAKMEIALTPGKMIPLAVATSVDAMAAGVTLAFLYVDIVPAVTYVGATTFVLSAVGVRIGNILGEKFKSKANIFGGVILMLIGIWIVVERLI